MKKVLAILSIVTLASCGTGSSTEQTTTDSTKVVVDTTKTTQDSTVVKDTTKACCVDSTKVSTEK